MKLIPITQEKEQALNQAFEETLFKSSEMFIKAYNSGLVNKRNEHIIDFANRVAATFRNIELSNSELVTISTDEISVNEILSGIEKWKIVVAVKAAVTSLDRNGKLNDVIRLVASDNEKKGVLYIDYQQTEDDGETSDIREAVSSKIAPNSKAILAALPNYTVLDEDSGDVELDTAVQNVDTSFLERVAEEFVQAD